MRPALAARAPSSSLATAGKETAAHPACSASPSGSRRPTSSGPTSSRRSPDRRVPLELDAARNERGSARYGTSMLFTRKKLELPTADEALSGRDTPILGPTNHLVLGTPL